MGICYRGNADVERNQARPHPRWNNLCVRHLTGTAMSQDPQIATLSRLLDASALRAQVHAANIANQNTPGYHAKAVAFEDTFRQALEEDGSEAASQVTPTVYEPRSTMEQADGNDVSMNREVTEMAKNATMYNAYIQMLRGKNKLINLAVSQSPGG